jgi:dihydroxy-acid dehydratase
MRKLNDSKELYFGLSKEEFVKKYNRMMELTMPYNAILKREGYIDEELKLPRVALYNSWSEQSPGHVHFNEIARMVRTGINLAGGMCIESGMAGANACQYNMDYDLPSREATFFAIESGMYRSADAWVGLCSCDKVVPGMLLAACRLDKPCILVSEGPAMPGPEFEGETMLAGKGWGDVLYPKYFSGELSDEKLIREVMKATDICEPCVGTCIEMTTGESMQQAIEGLGMCLPGTAGIPAVFSERLRSSKRAGITAVDLARKKLKPSEIITEDSMRNAIAVLTAMGGGTNSFVHLQAVAYELGLDITPEDWDEIGRKVPTLTNVAPSDNRKVPNTMYSLHMAGGVPAVMLEIKDFLNLDCITVTGKTVRENLKDASATCNTDVIRHRENPFYPEGTMVILKGNIAPTCAVMRHSIVRNRELLQYSYEAVTFDSKTEAIRAILTREPKEVKNGQAIVIRYEGPRGSAMPDLLGVNRALRTVGLDKVCEITDGRTSGWTRDIPVIVNVCPEAYVGGPIAIIKDGDPINLDTKNRRLDADLSEEETKARLNTWKQREPQLKKGFAGLYPRLALQVDKGAGFPKQWTKE